MKIIKPPHILHLCLYGRENQMKKTSNTKQRRISSFGEKKTRILSQKKRRFNDNDCDDVDGDDDGRGKHNKLLVHFSFHPKSECEYVCSCCCCVVVALNVTYVLNGSRG